MAKVERLALQLQPLLFSLLALIGSRRSNCGAALPESTRVWRGASVKLKESNVGETRLKADNSSLSPSCKISRTKTPEKFRAAVSDLPVSDETESASSRPPKSKKRPDTVTSIGRLALLTARRKAWRPVA